MGLTLPVPWLRRLLAHTTTPLLPAFFWWTTLADGRDVEALGATIGLCYLVWLGLGLPGALFRRAQQKPAWTYVATAATLPVIILLSTGSGWRKGDWSLYLIVPVFALAGLWYWFCAYWRIPPPADVSAEPA